MANRRDVYEDASPSAGDYTVQIEMGGSDVVSGIITGTSADTAVAYSIDVLYGATWVTLVSGVINFTNAVPFVFAPVCTAVGGTGTGVRMPLLADQIRATVTVGATAITDLVIALYSKK